MRRLLTRRLLSAGLTSLRTDVILGTPLDFRFESFFVIATPPPRCEMTFFCVGFTVELRTDDRELTPTPVDFGAPAVPPTRAGSWAPPLPIIDEAIFTSARNREQNSGKKWTFLLAHVDKPESWELYQSGTVHVGIERATGRVTLCRGSSGKNSNTITIINLSEHLYEARSQHSFDEKSLSRPTKEKLATGRSEKYASTRIRLWFLPNKLCMADKRHNTLPEGEDETVPWRPTKYLKLQSIWDMAYCTRMVRLIIDCEMKVN